MACEHCQVEMDHLSVRIPKTLRKAVAEAARDVGIAKWVRKALEAYLASQESK